MGRRFPSPGGAASSGGGGSSSSSADGELHNGTPVADVLIERTANDDRKPGTHTSGLMPAAAPNGNIKSRNVFATWAQWRDQVSGYSGFSVSSFSVDRSTGAITVLQGGPQNLYNNGGQGAARSTTYCVFEPVHGCFFSAGNNGYTSGSHQFGYVAGQITTAGLLNGGQMSQSGADHSRNGSYCGCLPQGTGTQYFMTSGYQSYQGYRLHTADASGITVGTWVNNGSWTSSGGPWSHIYQPDQTPNSGEVTCGGGSSFSSPNYGWTLARGNSVTDLQPMDNGYSEGDIYQGAGGVPFLVRGNNHYGTLGNGSNSFVSLVDNHRDFGSHIMQMNDYGIKHVGIGENKFLFFRPGDDAFNNASNLVELVGIESNQNPKRLAHLQLGEPTDKSVLDYVQNAQNYFTVYENDNDTYPKWLIEGHQSSERYAAVKVYEITADFSQYTI